MDTQTFTFLRIHFLGTDIQFLYFHSIIPQINKKGNWERWKLSIFWTKF